MLSLVTLFSPAFHLQKHKEHNWRYLAFWGPYLGQSILSLSKLGRNEYFLKPIFANYIISTWQDIFLLLSIIVAGPWGHSSCNPCTQTHTKQKFHQCIFQGALFLNLRLTCETLEKEDTHFSLQQTDAECVMIYTIKWGEVKIFSPKKKIYLI